MVGANVRNGVVSRPKPVSPGRADSDPELTLGAFRQFLWLRCARDVESSHLLSRGSQYLSIRYAKLRLRRPKPALTMSCPKRERLRALPTECEVLARDFVWRGLCKKHRT